MESYVVENSEAEGHLSFYAERSAIWKVLKRDALPSIIESMGTSFHQLFLQCHSGVDAYLHLQKCWVVYMAKFSLQEANEKQLKIILEKAGVASDTVHISPIIQTVGKHVFDFCHKQHQPCVSQPHHQPDTSPSPRIKRQNDLTQSETEIGVHVLSGGVMGQMFRLFKKNRAKYIHERVILAKLLADKKKANVSVVQRCRDRGGLYIMKDVLMPVMRRLDSMIVQEVKKKHGKDVIKVSSLSYAYLDVCTCVLLCKIHPRLAKTMHKWKRMCDDMNQSVR